MDSREKHEAFNQLVYTNTPLFLQGWNVCSVDVGYFRALP